MHSQCGEVERVRLLRERARRLESELDVAHRETQSARRDADEVACGDASIADCGCGEQVSTYLAADPIDGDDGATPPAVASAR